jgi:hypothetical protein
MRNRQLAVEGNKMGHAAVLSPRLLGAVALLSTYREVRVIVVEALGKMNTDESLKLL